MIHDFRNSQSRAATGGTKRFNRQWKRIDDKGPGGVGDVAKLSGGGDSICVAANGQPEVDGIAHVGHEDPVFVLAGFEQLVLLGFLGFQFFAWLFLTQGHEPIRLAPSVRLVTEFAFRVGIRFGRRLPLSLA